MQSAVLAIVNPSVRLSVCLSHAGTVSKRLKYDHGVSPTTLVRSRLTSPRNSEGNIRSEGDNSERGRKNRPFLANRPKSPYLRNGAR